MQTCVCFAAPGELLGEVVGVAVVAVPGVPPPTLSELQAALTLTLAPTLALTLAVALTLALTLALALTLNLTTLLELQAALRVDFSPR